MQIMQLPTCTDVRIRSTHDAHKIFLAVQKGLLFMVNRRLDADERLALRSGCVYAWEERGPHTEITGLGIERFTEGRRWSPSRVRDEFLFYYEKYSPPQDGSQNSNPSEKQPPRDWDPLVKQTYSVWVDTEKGRRKWHLTAYFTQATVDQLGTVDDIPGMGSLVVPSGLFQSTRVGKNRKADDTQGRSNGSEPLKPAMTSSLPRTFAPFPAAYPRRRHSQSPPKSGTPKLYEPYPNANQAVQGQSLYTDSQFTVPSASPLVQVPLPPLRDLHQPSFDARRIPSTQQAFSSFGSQDIFDRSSSLDHSMSRAENGTYRAVGLTGGDVKTSPTSARLLQPLSTPQRTQADSLFLPVAESPTRCGEQTLQTSTSWYPSPTAIEPSLDHSLSFPIRNDMTTTYPIRATYSSLLEPALSVSATQQPAYSQSDSLSYPSLQSDSHGHHPYVPSQPYARLRSATTSSRLSSTQSSQPLVHSAGVDHTYLPTAVFDSHSPVDSCGFDNENRRGSVGPSRVDLAPLHALQRNHPYRRDPVDDRALRMLGPRSS